MSRTAEAPATFLWLVRADGIVVCHAQGDIDLTSRSEIRHTFDEIAARARGGIVVDLSGVGFCDSTGLNALFALRVAVSGNGTRLVLAGPGPQLARLLRLVGADPVLPVYPSLPEALAGLDGGAAVGGAAV